jgi:hypothetical protein
MSALIATSEGRFIKAFPLSAGKQIYGFHEVFGLVSEDSAQERLNSLKRKGSLGQERSWLCRFGLEVNSGKPTLKALEGCRIDTQNGEWLVHGAGKSWRLTTSLEGISFPQVVEKDQTPNNDRKYVYLALLLFLLISVPLLMWTPANKVEAPEIPEEQVTVVIRKIPTVKVSPSTTVMKTLNSQTKKVVQRDLGFLSLVGQKNLNKAVGGAQIKLNASPGAGRGGLAGSGGEVLSGLGRGVRATTVGNSGVQGLGGVGTKGIGGGGGGYGDVAIASGVGRGISAVAVSQGVGVDGGLDRHVIQATIAKYLSQVRACYEDRLRVNLGLEGTLTMDFEIGPSGRLNFSKVKSSTVGDPAVGNCVSAKMMGWEFPKPRGGVNVKVNYPFALRPVGR